MTATPATKFARVAFVNKSTGARIQAELIADTGPTWLIKPSGGHPATPLKKDEWESVAPDLEVNDLLGSRRAGADIFSTFFSGGAR